jgi:ketosteroid isomerase-like protein
MAGQAYDVIKRFWDIQNAGDYTQLVALFADDARLVDPFYGTFEGKAAIAGFMTKMNAEMGGQNISFVLEELAGDGETAWAQWIAKTPRGDKKGCGLYRVRNGKLTYYRDYMMS